MSKFEHSSEIEMYYLKKKVCFVLVLVQKLLTENGTRHSYVKA